METQTFKRRVAKTLTRYTVSSAITAVLVYAANEVVEPEDDSVVKDSIVIGAMTTGFVVSHALQPRTDAMVDRVADWHIARKAEEAEHPAES